MLLTILNWFSGGTLNKLLTFFADRDQARIDAMTSEQQRTHEANQDTKQHAKDVRLATAGYWEMRVLTVAIALPFIVHEWLVAWDTLWPQPWNVEKFPEPFNEWQGAILLSFFGLVGVSMGARAIAGAIAMRYK